MHITWMFEVLCACAVHDSGRIFVPSQKFRKEVNDLCLRNSPEETYITNGNNRSPFSSEPTWSSLAKTTTVFIKILHCYPDWRQLPGCIVRFTRNSYSLRILKEQAHLIQQGRKKMALNCILFFLRAWLRGEHQYGRSLRWNVKIMEPPLHSVFPKELKIGSPCIRCSHAHSHIGITMKVIYAVL